MYDEGGLVVRRLMISESPKEPHEENGLGLGTGVSLVECVTVQNTLLQLPSRVGLRTCGWVSAPIVMSFYDFFTIHCRWFSK